MAKYNSLEMAEQFAFSFKHMQIQKDSCGTMTNTIVMNIYKP